MPWEFTEEMAEPFFVAGESLGMTAGIRLTDPDTRVLNARGDTPTLTLHAFGKGKAVYLGDFFYSPAGARMLLEILLHLTGADGSAAGLTDQFLAECAWFPEAKTLVVMNNSDMPMDVKIALPFGSVQAHPGAEEICFIPVGK